MISIKFVTENPFFTYLLFFLPYLICTILGYRRLQKIPSENLRARLMCVTQFSFIAIFLFFIISMGFRNLPYLSAPDEFTPNNLLLQRYYENIESLKIAYNALFYSFLLWVLSFVFLLKEALKVKT